MGSVQMKLFNGLCAQRYVSVFCWIINAAINGQDAAKIFYRSPSAGELRVFKSSKQTRRAALRGGIFMSNSP